ncbi:MAG: Ig-like domain-containing protein [Proteobacteria bacterium]|nr:Ig-like domain-containing protein [Pseudomonadota bacterium]
MLPKRSSSRRSSVTPLLLIGLLAFGCTAVSDSDESAEGLIVDSKSILHAEGIWQPADDQDARVHDVVLDFDLIGNTVIVQIVRRGGQPAAGLAVRGTFSGDVTASAQQTTDDTGTATFGLDVALFGTVRFEIDSIVAPEPRFRGPETSPAPRDFSATEAVLGPETSPDPQHSSAPAEVLGPETSP